MKTTETTDVVCGCSGPADLHAVVDMLDRTFERTPREYFERHLLRDPTLRPDDTRVLIHGRDIVSSVQIFPRIMTIAGEHMAFGGIGNVGTDPCERRKGLAAIVMEDAIRVMRERDYQFSVLNTTIHPYYERFGYRTVVREVAVVSHIPGTMEVGVRPFQKLKDLQRVKELYRVYNDGDVGPLVRDDVYWDGQIAFSGEDPDKFLVLERDGAIVGYIRAGMYKSNLEILEHAAEGDIAAIFATLLRAVSSLAPGIPIKMFLPECERERLRLTLQYTILEDTDLMILPLSERFHAGAEDLVMRRNAMKYWRSDFF